MKIKYIRLKNIRSYKDQQIAFPQGSLLLSGDIGSGKSTILLAMEYALFGIQKGSSAQLLLRHGEDAGAVELCFELEGSEIVIIRSMKRGKSIKQEECWISMNGRKYECTTTQLKAKVLELFGYPREVMTKNIPIFRYTVYTPQEEMKAIMVDSESRLSTLRKIFGIEKYSNIAQNTSIVTKHLNAEARHLEDISKNLEEKIVQAESADKEMKVAYEELQRENAMLDASTQKLREEEKALENMRNMATEISALKQKLSACREEMDHLASWRKAAEKELSLSLQKIENTRKEASDMEKKMPDAPANEVDQEEAEAYEKLAALKEKSAVIESEMRKLSGVTESGKCPFCLREAEPEHFALQIEQRNRELQKLEAEITPCEKKLAELSAEKKRIQSSEMMKYKINILRESIESQIRAVETRRKEIASTENKILYLQRDIAFATAKIENSGNYEEEYKTHGTRIRELHGQRLAISSSISRKEQIISSFRQRVSQLNEEIEKMKLVREKASGMREASAWMDTVLLKISEMIEKRVMNALQKEFNGIFQYWFSLLMEESLFVKIDEAFSPVIIQNSFETSYEHLSGGEKTAIALAYRLSLNKVINMMIGTIKTKDLLVLDEPTEGFSSEQLDRVRDVINQLELAQVIMVSHDPKIDTFVDNILNVYKEGHVSRIR